MLLAELLCLFCDAVSPATAFALTFGLMLPGSNDGCVWETNCVAKGGQPLRE